MILRGGHVIYGFSLAVESEDNVGRRGISTVWCVCAGTCELLGMCVFAAFEFPWVCDAYIQTG